MREINKEEFIRRYGIKAWGRAIQQAREWQRDHPKEVRKRCQKWYRAHPEQVKARNQKVGRELSRKGGKYYEAKVLYQSTGLQGERGKIRRKHAGHYRPYKRIIAPETQIHHEWLPETADYRGVALVEKDQHQHGFVDVIQILEGEITLFTEEDIRRGA